MKRVRISIALLGLVLGSITSLAFKTQEKLVACISGPAADSSQCGRPGPMICCETANHTKIFGDYLP